MDVFQLILEALPQQVALLADTGVILWTNQAWRRFGWDNGTPKDYVWKGSSYVTACRDTPDPETDGGDAASGLRAVLDGRSQAFELEYPCHGPNVRRWFLMTAQALVSGGHRHVVVMHQNITRRKEAELLADRQASEDILTGLANRRLLDRFVVETWRRSRRLQSPMSVLMIDVDEFKPYNDTLGHVAGDACLQQVASALGQCARRPDDLVARFGGEEFCIVLGNTGSDQAAALAERCRAAVESLDLPHPGARHHPRVTISIGVATRTPARHDQDPIAIVGLADKALYAAKTGGRNRVSVCRLADASAPQNAGPMQV